MAQEKFINRVLEGKIEINLNNPNKPEEPTKTWFADKIDIVKQIVYIINKYQEEGYKLTLRQLYYQLVARDWIPNHDKVYKKISKILDDCRYSGTVDWNAIEDRGRIPKTPYIEVDVPGAIERTEMYYNLDKRLGQQNYIELWSEKDAISNILIKATRKYTTTIGINKGFASSTAMYDAYERFTDIILGGQNVVVLYFGDHDPSGLDMVRDIRDRLEFMFIRGNKGGEIMEYFLDKWGDNALAGELQRIYEEHTGFKYAKHIFEDKSSKLQKRYGFIEIIIKSVFEVRQIGLTMEQIEEHNLPHNPAKMSDSRSAKYVAVHGEKSWEVDALEPSSIVSIIETEFSGLVDMSLINNINERERKDKRDLIKLIENYKRGFHFSDKDEWGEWDCPNCDYRQSDPENITHTVCGGCESPIILSHVVNGKRKAILNLDV